MTETVSPIRVRYKDRTGLSQFVAVQYSNENRGEVIAFSKGLTKWYSRTGCSYYSSSALTLSLNNSSTEITFQPGDWLMFSIEHQYFFRVANKVFLIHYDVYAGPEAEEPEGTKEAPAKQTPEEDRTDLREDAANAILKKIKDLADTDPILTFTPGRANTVESLAKAYSKLYENY